MKIALVDLCQESDFKKHRSYKDSIDFLVEEKIDYLDFATGADNLDGKVTLFNDALNSDADLVWFIRGGSDCLRVLNKIDWDKVVGSNKIFYGLSDFTHFAAIAVTKGVTCYYGQGLAYVKDFLPERAGRQFIVDFLKENKPTCERLKVLDAAGTTEVPNVFEVNVIGGYLPGFILLQNGLKTHLQDKYVFIEYHSGALGETLDDLGYILSQFMYVINQNTPKGIIVGHIELNNLDQTQIATDAINSYCVGRFSELKIPVFFVDHFKSTIKLMHARMS